MSAYNVRLNPESVWARELTARGDTIEHAASHVARRINRRYVALRNTGTPTLSGYFDVWRPTRAGGLTTTGDRFHIAEA